MSGVLSNRRTEAIREAAWLVSADGLGLERVADAAADVVLHFDDTGAVEPLERTQPWVGSEVPETFPTGI